MNDWGLWWPMQEFTAPRQLARPERMARNMNNIVHIEQQSEQPTSSIARAEALDAAIADLRIILATIASEAPRGRARDLPTFEAHALLTRISGRAAITGALWMEDVDAFCAKLGDLDIRHPGEIFATDFFPAFGVSARFCAQELGITPAMLSLFMNGKRGISVDLAVRLAKLCGTSPAFWLHSQAMHELVDAAAELAERIRRIPRLPMKAALAN